MDLRERVMQILDGRIKLGAAAPKKKNIISRVPPSRTVPNSSKGQKLAKRSNEHAMFKMPTDDETLKHLYPLNAPVIAVDPTEQSVLNALQDLLTDRKPAVRESANIIANGIYGGVQIGGEQVTKNRGGKKTKTSKWIEYAKKIQKENGVTYKEALKTASKTYKKSGGRTRKRQNQKVIKSTK